MDMPTPKAPDPSSDIAARATLARLAQMLDCSPERFFDAARTGETRDASHLTPMWLAIKSPEGREAVFAFVDEVLRVEALEDQRDVSARWPSGLR